MAAIIVEKKMLHTLKHAVKQKTSAQVATLPLRLIFAIVSACGFHFRPFEPQLGLRFRFRPAASIFGSSGLTQLGLRPRYTTLHLTLQRNTALTLCCSVAVSY